MIFRKKIWLFLLVIFVLPCFTHAQALTAQQKADLQNELNQVEAQQKQAENELANVQAQSASLQRDISVLTAKIKAAQLNIKAKNLLIQTLGNDITAKQNHINDLEGHISRGKDAVGDILRRTNELDSYSIQEVILSQTSVAGFFADIDAFDSIHQSLQSTLDNLQNDQASTTAEKDALDARRNKEIDARYAIQQEQQNIQSDESQKQQLLAVNKGSEKQYNDLIRQKLAEGAKIKAMLFPLVGGGQPIPFGDAYRYALDASKKTGVRPAFLLAIFAQESSVSADSTFGKNVGSCFLANISTGEGIGVNTHTTKPRTMNPTYDVPNFLNILSALGMDINSTRVSCWIAAYNKSNLPTGWGGAMGPAQFIPSTWMKYKDRIANAVGISGMPNPWNPLHAFTAASLFLADLKASNGGYTAERNAACAYFSGYQCGAVKGNVAYGNSVMSLADSIQRTMIDSLQGI